MPDLQSQMSKMTPAEARWVGAPKARAGALFLQYAAGQLRLDDSTLAAEEPETLAWLREMVPSVRITTTGTTRPPAPSRLSPELQRRVNALAAPLDAQFAATDARALSEDQVVRQSVNFMLDAARDADLRLPGEGEGDAPSAPKRGGEVRLSDQERAAVGRLLDLAGVERGGAA